MYSEEECQYLHMMQKNIQRMATNSANIKKWTIAVVTAFLGMGIKISDLNYWLLLTLVPIALFWYLDAYYLKLERGFRNREQYYINLKRGIEHVDSSNDGLNHELFDFRPLVKKSDNSYYRYVSTNKIYLSKSVCSLYVILALLVILITAIINGWISCFCDL